MAAENVLLIRPVGAHADAVLGSAAVPRVAYSDSSSLMPLRQAPHRPDLVSSVCVQSFKATQTHDLPMRLGWVAKRNQGGAAALGRAGDIRVATRPGLVGQHQKPTRPEFKNSKP